MRKVQRQRLMTVERRDQESRALLCTYCSLFAFNFFFLSMPGVATPRLANLMWLLGVPRAARGSLVNFPYPGQEQTKRLIEKGQVFVFSGLCHHTQIGQGSCFINVDSQEETY